MAALTRSSTDRILGGVCGGIAEHFGWDPTLVRVAAVAAAVLGSAGLWIYLIAWIVIPASDGSSGISFARDKWDENKRKSNGTDQNFDPYKD